MIPTPREKETERVLRLQTQSGIDADRILRLQCLAAVEHSIAQGLRLKRAQEIYDFVTDTKPEDTDTEQPDRNPVPFLKEEATDPRPADPPQAPPGRMQR